MNIKFLLPLLLLVFVACEDNAAERETSQQPVTTPAIDPNDPNGAVTQLRRSALDENDVTARLNRAFDKYEAALRADASALRLQSVQIDVTDGCQVSLKKTGTDGITRESRFDLSDFSQTTQSLRNDDEADIEFPAIRLHTDRNLGTVEYYENGKLVEKRGYVDFELATKQSVERIAALVPQVTRTCNQPVVEMNGDR